MKELYLRDATENDVDLLYQWVNDPVTRQSAFSTGEITYETHKKWFKGVLEKSDVKQLICMCDDIPVGQIRANFYGDVAELDYSIGPEYRKAGYGSELIKLGVEYIKRNFSEIKAIVAKVKKENIGSQKVLANNGFTERVIQYVLDV